MSTQEFLGQLLKKTTVTSLELDNKINLHIPKKSNKTLDYIIYNKDHGVTWTSNLKVENGHLTPTHEEYSKIIFPIPKSQSGKIDTHNTQIHDQPCSWLGTNTSIKSGGVKLI